jgi:short subunit dehydrogenase-like uncharacterized protein
MTPALPLYGSVLIYGANGYTAELIIERALSEGARPILAGRSVEKLAALARRTGLPARRFSLDSASDVVPHLEGVSVVLNCAGPFVRTATVLAEACMQAGVHYLDISGEVEVFEAMAARNDQARVAGVMLMSGVGVDIVPSDCLITHLKQRLPDATHLTLAVEMVGGVSHGTATTLVENLNKGGLIRRNGKLTAVPTAWAVRDVDLGRGTTRAMSVPWGDVVTGWLSTGIPNIEAYIVAPFAMRAAFHMTRYCGALMGSRPVQNWLKKKVDAAPRGPDAEQRRQGHCYMWAEVRNVAGQLATARLEAPEGYSTSALTAWDIAKRCVDGQAQAGYRTPSMVFGADYILGFEGTRRVDLR